MVALKTAPKARKIVDELKRCGITHFIYLPDDGTRAILDILLDEGQVTSILRRAVVVTMKAPLGREDQPSYGMDAPNAVVTLETPEETVTLRVGARDADASSYVVKSSVSPYYVHVAEFNAKALVENGRDAFLQEPAAPEETSSGS